MGWLVHALTLSLASAVLPAAQAPTQPGLPTEPEIIGVDEDRYERMTLPVHVGDHGPFRFLLDTGSERTVLSSSLANQLALPLGEVRTIVSVAGRRQVQTAEVDRIHLGKRSYYGLVTPILERVDIGADGILGIDSLQGQRVLLNFRENYITINDARSLGGDKDFDIVVKARRREGQLIMTHAMIDGKRTRVIIDTGSEVTIGNNALQRALSQRVTMAETTLFSATGHKVPADIGFAKRLSFGDVTISNVAIAFADAAPFETLGLHERPALMLGMRELRVFKRIAIDFSERKVLFDLPEEFEFE